MKYVNQFDQIFFFALLKKYTCEIILSLTLRFEMIDFKMYFLCLWDKLVQLLHVEKTGAVSLFFPEINVCNLITHFEVILN